MVCDLHLYSGFTLLYTYVVVIKTNAKKKEQKAQTFKGKTSVVKADRHTGMPLPETLSNAAEEMMKHPQQGEMTELLLNASSSSKKTTTFLKDNVHSHHTECKLLIKEITNNNFKGQEYMFAM